VRTTALTERGAGSWLLVPLVTPAGDTILVNRAGSRRRAREVAGARRPSRSPPRPRPARPGRAAPYSRDVAAIAAAKGLGDVAPYFIDADASGNWPGEDQVVVAKRHHGQAADRLARPIAGCVGVDEVGRHVPEMAGYAVFRLLRER
jgi:surfeit locus 1 family protein